MNEDKYPLTNVEAVAELCKDPTREIEAENGARIRLIDGHLEISDEIRGHWTRFVLWPGADCRYRALTPSEPEVLKPVELAPEVSLVINAWSNSFDCAERAALEHILGLAIAQAIRDARGEK